MTADKNHTAIPTNHGEQQRSAFGQTECFNPATPTDVSQRSGDAATAELWVGKSLGKYHITGVLGQGGMGVVFKARDPIIERDVAIKLLADQLSADETVLARFLAEARAAGKLSHANVAAVYEISQEGERHFLVMEYVPGGSLSDRLEKQGACSVLEATQAMIGACRGIAAAHAAGLIHRDLKPANMLRAADGSIKVTDFGLAKTTSAKTQQLTQAGLLVGTPFFMSPEQCEARPVDTRSDIYSLGATYHSLLTGKNPFQDSDSVPQLMYNHCHGPIPDPRAVSAAIPAACAQIVARAMAKAPDDRYQSVGAMLADLEAVAATLSGQTAIDLPSVSRIRQAPPTDERVAPRRRRLALPVAGGIAALALLAAALIWRPWQGSGPAAPGTPPATLPGGEPVKVGVLHSLSGTMAGSEMVVVDAVLFALEEVNQGGGVLGRPVKPVVVDGRSDWPTFAAEAQRLIAKEKVCTVFGCWTSASRKTVLPIFEQHDHLLIYPLQYEGVETSPNVIYMGAAPNQQIIPAVEWAVKSLGKQRFFLVGSDYVFPRTANEVIKDHLKGLGAQVVGEEYLPLGSQNVQAVVSAMAKAKPDMILNTINGDSNIAFFRGLRAAGMKPADTPSLSFSVGEQELRSLNLADMAGDYAAWTYFQSVDTAANQEFVRRFQEKFPQHRVTDPMEAAYVGVKLWARAVNEAQTLDPKKIRRAMLNQRLTAPCGEVRIDPDTQHCFKTPRIGQIQADGQFKIVWTAPAPVHPEPFPSTRTAADWKAYLHDLYAGWGNRWSAPEAEPPKLTPAK